MQFIHYELKAGIDKIIQVTIDSEADVKLMDTFNFTKYKKGRTPDYQGGTYPASTIEFRVDKTDTWHVVIDLGGKKGEVKASVKLINC
ncbi:MAG: DUF1883 domain-containing protein [Spirochaetales bacterium]|nr:DUF1883 domain-containing protein [Spirochaetales bacterium]